MKLAPKAEATNVTYDNYNPNAGSINWVTKGAVTPVKD